MDSVVLVSKFGGFRVPRCTSSTEKTGISRAKEKKYSVESLEEAFKEVVSRVTEIKVAFGGNALDHCFCVQVKDYVAALMEREKTRLKYQRTSPQRAARGAMVKLLMRIAEGEELTRSTLHLAVYLFDRFSDFHTIPVTQLWLAALSCLVIAGKLEERDTKTPKMRKLRDYLPPAAEFRTLLFVQMEKYILDYFKWSLLIPNSYTFAQFYVLFIVDSLEEPVRLDVGVVGGKDKSNKRAGILQDETFSGRNVSAVRFFAIEVLDTLLCDEPDDNYAPSLVAAATLMYSRRRFGYSEWSSRLEFLTSYSKSQVLPCCEHYVKRVYEAHNTKS